MEDCFDNDDDNDNCIGIYDDFEHPCLVDDCNDNDDNDDCIDAYDDHDHYLDRLCLVEDLERSISVVLSGRVWKYSLSSTWS